MEELKADGKQRERRRLGALMKRLSSLTPTANCPMSAPFPRAAAVSSLAILVMKFLALLAD